MKRESAAVFTAAPFDSPEFKFRHYSIMAVWLHTCHAEVSRGNYLKFLALIAIAATLTVWKFGDYPIPTA